MQQFDVSFAIRRGAPGPVLSGGCEESLFEKRSIAVGVLEVRFWTRKRVAREAQVP